MKKYIFVALLLGLFVVTPAFALTPLSTEQYIAQLKAQVEQLLARLNELIAQQNQNFCYDFNHNFRDGDNDGDKEKFKEVLKRENVKDGKAFQTKYGIPSTGYVGPLTRAKLNALYRCKPVDSNAPVITGVSGPTTLKVGETGTWTVNAKDPNNGTLTYRVRWGDELVSPTTPFSGAVSSRDDQMSTFSHAYGQVGVFNPTFSVGSAASGQTSQATLSVNVTGSTQPSVTVTSPNGGEMWVAKTTQAITWAPGATVRLSADAKVDLYLDPIFNCPTCGSVAPAYYLPYTLDKNIAFNSVYNWIVATDINNKDIPAGTYQVRVCLAGTTTCDSSDRPFNIVVSKSPSVTVTTPNGGEYWPAGSIRDINWSVANLGETFAAQRYDLYLDPACIGVCTAMYRPPVLLDRNILSGPYHWIVASPINTTNTTIPAGAYKVRVCFAGAETICDSSDQPFTIYSNLAQPAVNINGDLNR